MAGAPLPCQKISGITDTESVIPGYRYDSQQLGGRMKIAVATAMALAAATLTLNAAPAQADVLPTSFHESFAAMADGPPAESPSVTNFQYEPSAAPYVRNGYLSTLDPETADAGSYRIAHLGADVTRVEATFAFSDYEKAGGVLCLSIQATSIADGHPVPVSPMHFVVSPEGWWLDVNTEQGTGVETLAAKAHPEPLVADGETLHRVEVELNRDAKTVRLTLPDGSQRTFTNDAFGLPGSYVYVEPFKNPGIGPSGEQTDALVREWWADTTPVGDLGIPQIVPVKGEPVTPPVVIEAPAPTPIVVSPQGPVSAAVDAPGRPHRVRAAAKGKRIIVQWNPTAGAESYRVKCGRRSKATQGTTAKIRSDATRCKVRATWTGGTSPWSTARVKRLR